MKGLAGLCGLTADQFRFVFLQHDAAWHSLCFLFFGAKLMFHFCSCPAKVKISPRSSIKPLKLISLYQSYIFRIFFFIKIIICVLKCLWCNSTSILFAAQAHQLTYDSAKTLKRLNLEFSSNLVTHVQTSARNWLQSAGVFCLLLSALYSFSAAYFWIQHS